MHQFRIPWIYDLQFRNFYTFYQGLPLSNMEKLIATAKQYLAYGYSDAFIESQMWANRSSETGIRHIVQAIEAAKGQ